MCLTLNFQLTAFLVVVVVVVVFVYRAPIDNRPVTEGVTMFKYRLLLLLLLFLLLL